MVMFKDRVIKVIFMTCAQTNQSFAGIGCLSFKLMDYYLIFNAADATTPPPTSCKDLTCHFGATCVEREGLALCECHTECAQDREAHV